MAQDKNNGLATTGILYYYPWEHWGNFKYLMYVPMVARAWYRGVIQGCPLGENLCFNMVILASMRYLMFQVWGTVARLPYFSRKYQIMTKGIKFEQIDQEANWENMMVVTAYFIWVGAAAFVPAEGLKAWDWRGLPIVLLVHAGPVELLYYWGHRALHHHFLFTRYHRHHHSSFVTQPITSSNHPFLELIFYHTLFALPLMALNGVGCSSLGVIYFYILFIDFMNAWGHCNFEFIPIGIFKRFWILKYIVYSPTFHSLHHSKIHTNFSLFMPLYDYLYGTVDAVSDSLHEDVRKRGCNKKKMDCVYLTQMTELLSTFHLPFGFQTFAAQPYSKKWYMRIIWPVTFPVMLLVWLFARPFVSATHFFGNKMELQTWVIPRFSIQYFWSLEAAKVNGWIEDCIVQAQQAGAKVIALGLLNKDQKLDVKTVLRCKKELSIAIVTGDILAAAIVATKVEAKHKADMREVFLSADADFRVGRAIATYLCEHGFTVLVLLSSKGHIEELRRSISTEFQDNLVHAKDYKAAKNCKVWIVGNEIGCEAQTLAPKGSYFYQFGVFAIRKWRKDCSYSGNPGLRLPLDAQNINACEDVMPRYVVRTSYAAAMLHMYTGLNYHDLDGEISTKLMLQSIELALQHGFSVAY